MTNEEMLKVLEDLKYQFDDRIEEAEYCKEEDILEALKQHLKHLIWQSRN